MAPLDPLLPISPDVAEEPDDPEEENPDDPEEENPDSAPLRPALVLPVVALVLPEAPVVSLPLVLPPTDGWPLPDCGGSPPGALAQAQKRIDRAHPAANFMGLTTGG
jgi:hypothetical protein